MAPQMDTPITNADAQSAQRQRHNEPGIFERVGNWLKSKRIKISSTEFDHVYGSRRVIKDPNNPDQRHFYETSGDDIWTLNGRKIDDLVPENFVIYGELIGWTPEGQPIQRNYTYDVPQGEAHLYIYRVAVVTNGGLLIDLSWDQVKHFAEDRGLKHVPELWRGKHEDWANVAPEWMDVRYADHPAWRAFSEHEDSAVPLSDKKTVDEGVVVRTDIGRAPYLLKAKSPIFLQHETRLADQEIIDIETEGSEPEDA